MTQLDSELFDSHAHLSDDSLFSDAQGVLLRAREAGISKIVNVCTDGRSLQRGQEIRKFQPDLVFNAAAVPPHYCHESSEEDLKGIESAILAKEVVAIGETGLDYYYGKEHRTKQIKLLERYLALAAMTHLPVFFHVRGEGAFSELFSLVRYAPVKMLIHCFTGTTLEAKQALDLGIDLSFSGIVTFKKSEELRCVVKMAPLDRIHVETDSPYLAPQTKRGKTNEPSFLPEILRTIASQKEITPQECAKKTFENSCRFFSICD
ncbi:MAG: hypothetical protein A3F09_02160 [Chlamydiae bacterium RIFCSPHIGHO2_12_FULL_49_11]|nr:MAG: hypothetical protein A3F09_02160 [Chlamydiae bacterium RIFCSPHIGHO2_12_FULL_49_11]